MAAVTSSKLNVIGGVNLPTPPPILDHCYPTTITHTDTNIISNPSSTQFPLEFAPKEPNFWESDKISAPVQNTPYFFQLLLGDDPPTSEQCSQLGEDIKKQELLSCSDGAYCPGTNKGSHGWVFSTATQNYMVTGAGMDDGHPISMSSYRTELGGILAALYIIHRICEYYNIMAGKATLFCDN
jgi:hypothetical protein